MDRMNKINRMQKIHLLLHFVSFCKFCLKSEILIQSGRCNSVGSIVTDNRCVWREVGCNAITSNITDKTTTNPPMMPSVHRTCLVMPCFPHSDFIITL